MAVWRIELLGGVRACCADLVVDRFPTQKAAAILAYLALNPRKFHSREVLAELFWPEASPSSQRHSLRLALSRLRAALGSDHPLDTGRLGVRLDPARVITDVAEFESAVARQDNQTARRLYAGPLLPGHYDAWVIDEQSRLEALLDGLGEESSQIPQTLPQGVGSLFGRTEELAAVSQLLGKGKLVTLIGAGGMGKTRLAIAVVQNHDRSIWVPLADLGEPKHIADAIRSALRLPVPAPGFAVEDQIEQELRALSPVLLVLDNAEHLVSETLCSLVARVTQVADLIVTSRKALGLPEEEVFLVGPLNEADSAALFEDRARRARAGLVAPNDVLTQLAKSLGGIPLALELGAARAGVQSLSEIESTHWGSETEFGEAIGIPERQRSLDQVLRSSLALLPPAMQTAFCKLGVFRGGFDAVAAHAVAGANPATLDTLRRWGLILPIEEEQNHLRFRMPEPLREVAQQNSGDAAQAHAQYFADWVEANRADDLPPPPRQFAQRLLLQERERDNILAALETCRKSDRETGLRIVAAFWTHWFVRNAGQEMEFWARSLLDGPSDKFIRASAQLSLALAIRERGAREDCLNEIENALHVLQQGPRDRNLAFAYHLYGLSLQDFVRFDQSESAYLEAESIWIEIGDQRNYSITRHNRGMLAAETGELEKAESLVGEAMELFREHSSTYLAIGNATLGSIRMARHEYAGAAAALTEAIRVHQILGYVRGWAQNERDLALCMYKLGRPEKARAAAEKALGAFRRVGDRHGEATALVMLTQVTGETWHLDEAKGVIARHSLPLTGDLLAL